MSKKTDQHLLLQLVALVQLFGLLQKLPGLRSAAHLLCQGGHRGQAIHVDRVALAQQIFRLVAEVHGQVQGCLATRKNGEKSPGIGEINMDMYIYK